jgi:hypothetical protein
MQWFYDHIGSVEFLDGGFQLRASWGLLFGIPLTFALMLVFKKINQVWRWFANANTAPAR